MDKTSEDFKHLTNDVRPHRKQHWLSIYHQLAVPVCLEDAKSVLEFGPGRGLFANIMRYYGINYKCSDVVDFGAKPDYMHAIKDFPQGETFDLVCAFQVLEHNPPEEFLPHLKKMREISNKYVYISLPYYGRWIAFDIAINIPKINRSFSVSLCWPRLFKKSRPLDEYRDSDKHYEYHWFEVGDKGFSKKDIEKMAAGIGLKQIKAFHSSAYPYHYFILFEKV